MLDIKGVELTLLDYMLKFNTDTFDEICTQATWELTSVQVVSNL